MNSFIGIVFDLQKQARRVYEILRLKATDRSNQEAYKTYRLMVKNRLNGPHQVCCWSNELKITAVVG